MATKETATFATCTSIHALILPALVARTPSRTPTPTGNSSKYYLNLTGLNSATTSACASAQTATRTSTANASPPIRATTLTAATTRHATTASARRSLRTHAENVVPTRTALLTLMPVSLNFAHLLKILTFFTQNSDTHTCKCAGGYEGDGFVCTLAEKCNKYCPTGTSCRLGKCSCGLGYWFDDANRKCVDFNECKLTGKGETRHNCHPDATCENTTGGFKCKCKNGFFGDGVTCHGNGGGGSAYNNNGGASAYSNLREPVERLF
jgi:hypothetical protein